MTTTTLHPLATLATRLAWPASLACAAAGTAALAATPIVGIEALAVAGVGIFAAGYFLFLHAAADWLRLRTQPESVIPSEDLRETEQ